MSDHPSNVTNFKRNRPRRKFARPDPAFLSEAIPTFFIGRNGAGYWVARESEGRTGGIFLDKSAALRFAQVESTPHGCAYVRVPDPLELDLPPRAD